MRTGAQRPRLWSYPDARTTSAGRDAAEFAATCGLFLDDWQEWVLDGILSEDPAGRFCAETCLLLVPRQNGKNAILEALELYAFYVLDEELIVHTAQLADTSAKHMRRLEKLIKRSPELEALTDFYKSNGKEHFARKDTGARIEFITRGKRTLRGGSPSRVVFDEALYLTDDHLDAIVPALSAQSMGDDVPQLIYTSSAPLEESIVLHRVRAACQAGMPSSFYAEWSAELPDVPGAMERLANDRDAWAEANPGLNVRISEGWIERNELVMLSPQGFLAERVGVAFGGDGIKELAGWSKCLDAESQMDAVPAIALDVALDLGRCSIAVAGARSDGLLHVELVSHLQGTAEVVDHLAKMSALHGGEVWLDPKTCGDIAADLVAAGVTVHEATAGDLAKACSRVRRMVSDRTLRHRGQAPLDAAVAGAATRIIGDGWSWSRRSSSVDISPLVAITLALWAAQSPAVAGDQFAFVL